MAPLTIQTATKLTFQNHIYDNTYCTFRIAMEQATKDAESLESTPRFFRSARDHAVKQRLPQAFVYVKRILDNVAGLLGYQD